MSKLDERSDAFRRIYGRESCGQRPGRQCIAGSKQTHKGINLTAIRFHIIHRLQIQLEVTAMPSLAIFIGFFT